MRVTLVPLLAILLMAPLVASQQYSMAGPDDVANNVPLKMKVYRKWSIKLPSEQWSTVGTGFNLKAGVGADFKAHLDGTALAVDIDADGKIDVKVETPQGHLILANGDRRYAVRVKTENSQWRFAPACVMMGKIGDTKVKLIDQDNNGRFNDFGKDAMVVGNGKVASLLSKVISIDSKLVELKIDADGSNLSYSPYTGPVASLKLDATCKGKIVASVVQSKDGQYSFGFSGAQNELQVPAQDYALHSGIISFGGNTVKVKMGKSKSINLAADGSGVITWGGPVRAEFTYVREGDKVNFDPSKIWFYGSAGEEYFGWSPLGKSPKITLNSTSGRELAQASFPGS
ncbi:MAG: hypothetical protein ACI97A_003496 [Planctomycetota bacterium]|jgi:hypothetical protein